jgi:two-component system, LytTR family, sensor kinase
MTARAARARSSHSSATSAFTTPATTFKAEDRTALITPKTADDAPATLVAEGWREDDSPSPNGASTRDARWWGVVVLVWLAAGATAALHQAAAAAVRGQLRNEWMWTVMQIPHWLLWAPVTPFIFAASQRHPFSRGLVARSLLTHLALAALAIVFVEGSYAQLALLVERLVGTTIAAGRPSPLALTAIAVLAPVSGIVTYTAVVCVASALTSQRRLRERDVRSALLEADLARAQVQAIKMQVQPHFLFNTLHAINVLIKEDPAVATRMITLLGDLLRHTLTRAAVTKVPLRSELDVLALYLDIERVRFRDRMTVTYDVANATLSALVPDLVLQPLAENAIKHGIGARVEGGTISITARLEHDMLILEVVDSGAGPAGDDPAPERIGLSTVRSRLERLYGSRQSLTLGRAPGGGCVARISLPLEEA